MSDMKSKRPLFNSHLKTQRDYWLNKLTRELGPTGLRPDFDRAATDVADQREQFEFTLPPAVQQRLTQLTGGAPLLVYAAALAALKVCLHKYTQSTTIVVGSPSLRAADNADKPGNALAIVTDLDEHAPFRQLLLDVRATLDEAYLHADYPFARVVRDLALSPAAHRCELFDVALAHSALHAELPAVNNDITITLRPEADTIVCEVVYAGHLFQRASIDRFIQHLLHLLERALADVNVSVGALDMVSATERQQVLEAWNDTRRAYPHDRTVHELFETQAAATPDAPAIVSGAERLTYNQLNRRANQLAHQLRSFGVGRETRVAICLERAPELLVGLLAILKAGGAYVPLDPTYPQERLAFMLADTEAAVLLTQTKFADGLPVMSPRVVCVDDAGAPDADWSDENPTACASADNLAYVMYTSGSTGQPKGVCVTHRSILRLVKSANYVQLQPGEVVLQFAPVTFDASTLEIWGALLNGACVALAPAQTLALEELGACIRGAQVTTMWLTAGLFHQMVEQRLDDLRGVRQLLAGGDVLSVAHVKRALQGVPGLTLINGYGPTECTTFACCHVMRDSATVSGTVPIGRPITNTQVFILDRQLRPAGIGVAGELYIGGDGLARNYLNSPELTAEKFVPDPFSPSGGARLYRTGDVVRYLADGCIEFVGRRDNQVKVRGFRVELGEIEAALAQCAGVREVVVMARVDQSGDKALTAYLVVDEAANVSLQQVRAQLEQQLPAYMLPSDYVFLPALPLSANGKVDRAQLPAPERSRRNLAERFVAPRNEIEQRVAAIWCDVLGLEGVGIHDNFFRLGGHSLLATKVTTRLRDSFEIELGLGRIFETPTVAEIAALIEQSDAPIAPNASGEIERVPRADEDLAHVLAELAQLSEVEVQTLLAQESHGADGTNLNE